MFYKAPDIVHTSWDAELRKTLSWRASHLKVVWEGIVRAAPRALLKVSTVGAHTGAVEVDDALENAFLFVSSARPSRGPRVCLYLLENASKHYVARFCEKIAIGR